MSWDADRVSVVFGVLDGSTGGFSVALGYFWPGPFPVWRQDKNPTEPVRVKREEPRPTERVVLLFSL